MLESAEGVVRQIDAVVSQSIDSYLLQALLQAAGSPGAANGRERPYCGRIGHLRFLTDKRVIIEANSLYKRPNWLQ
ncbi:hypothetical protein [Paenibacillus agaridevorans]|uniref:hypothetical protein n=1 Tax=Paenibacillus agaridevorans TaxID=171404 RepID=UPI001BE4B8AA|nr:hypothetical protein [Paenibacillus agaridevorans]